SSLILFFSPLPQLECGWPFGATARGRPVGAEAERVGGECERQRARTPVRQGQQERRRAASGAIGQRERRRGRRSRSGARQAGECGHLSGKANGRGGTALPARAGGGDGHAWTAARWRARAEQRGQRGDQRRLTGAVARAS
ncbi:unnamed protein product, partial [Urochloa humidicola]